MAVMKMGGRLLRNLFSKPATERYPAAPREYPGRSRGHLEFDPGNCILCNICGRSCPTGAINADKERRVLEIDRMSCVQCAYCADKCPKKCLAMVPGYTAPSPARKVDSFAVPEGEGRGGFP